MIEDGRSSFASEDMAVEVLESEACKTSLLLVVVEMDSHSFLRRSCTLREQSIVADCCLGGNDHLLDLDSHVLDHARVRQTRVHASVDQGV